MIRQFPQSYMVLPVVRHGPTVVLQDLHEVLLPGCSGKVPRKVHGQVKYVKWNQFG